VCGAELECREARFPAAMGDSAENICSSRAFQMPNRQIQLTAVYIKKLTGVLRELDTYVSGQFNSIINYAAARRSGEPISTAQTESAVHRLLHRRMTAKQQMRWSPRGAHFMLKVRTSVMNGTFEQDHIALAQSTRGQQRRAA